MKRDLKILSENNFDILIIGGGIYGTSLFWRAATSGYSAALIEQNDFASGTSSNSQKIIHGGLRYLQNLDILRIRQSVNERKRLMWLAPHLVSPLPCVMPLYGHKLKGKEALSVAIKLYDFLSADRNNIQDKSKHIPNGKILSKKKINDILPGLEQNDLTAGVLWYDAFCNNTERLILSLVKSAVKLGSNAANYLKAEKLIVENNIIKSVNVLDLQSQNHFSVKAKKVVACTGPDENGFYTNLNIPKQKYVAGLNIVVDKIFPHNFAAGIDNRFNKRLYFIAPWNDKSILGTDWYPVPDMKSFEFKKLHVEKFLENFNETYPAAGLTYKDIKFVHTGFVPAANNLQDPSSTLNHFKLINGADLGIKNFYKLIGVKYTTAVNVADNLLNSIYFDFKKSSLELQPKLIGGEIENLEEFRSKVYKKYGDKISEQKLENLVNNYGSEIYNILENSTITSEFDYSKKINYEIIKSQVIFAIKEEMALHLDDIIFRRTNIGSSGLPDNLEINFISKVASDELGWNETERIHEIKRIESYFRLLSKNSLFNKNLVTK
ncbi:MAG: FAD-dependent oxidoreductase [Ignavibacteriaceae bacterium]